MEAATGLCPGSACPTCGTDPGQPVLCPHPVRHWPGIGTSGLAASLRTNRPGRGPASRALWHAPGQVCPVLPAGRGEVHLQGAACPPGHPAGAGLPPGLRRGDPPKWAATEDAPDVYRGHRRLYHRCAASPQWKAGLAVLSQPGERRHHHG